MESHPRNQDIKYVQVQLPAFDLPAVTGQRYTAQVPDTLDLADLAAGAIDGMAGATDPQANAEIYWHVRFGVNPPMMYHDANDWVEYKWYAPSMLLRSACGSTQRLDVEWHHMANLLQMQGPDGLMCMPKRGRPWAESFGETFDFEGQTFQLADQVIAPVMHGRTLEAIAAYHLMTGDSRWRQIGDRAVAGLAQLATDQGDMSFFQKTFYAPGDTDAAGPVPPAYIHILQSWLAQGLITYHRMVGHEPALKLGHKLAKLFQVADSDLIGPDGEFGLYANKKDYDSGAQRIHFHSNTIVRLAMLDVGIEAGDRELIELAQRGYEYGKAHGQTLMGFFPEFLNVAPDAYGNTCEICEVADMIYLALRQSTCGIADCWDDVDRWVRNMFTESLLLETDWVDAYCRAHDTGFRHEHGVYEDVPQRVRGMWGGWIAPNDWQGHDEYSMMACCVGNAAMQLYRVWRDMISYDNRGKRLSIHLLLNRASPWADIDSHVPCRGQVDIKVKQDCELAVRVPQWTEPQQCRCTVNGRETASAEQGRYVLVKATTGDQVVFHCPLDEHRQTLDIVDQRYEAVVRGNTIVDISPAGRHYPLFHRPQFREDQTRWREAQRFIADDIVMSY